MSRPSREKHEGKKREEVSFKCYCRPKRGGMRDSDGENKGED